MQSSQPGAYGSGSRGTPVNMQQGNSGSSLPGAFGGSFGGGGSNGHLNSSLPSMVGSSSVSPSNAAGLAGICLDFLSGRCPRGPACSLSHALLQPAPQQLQQQSMPQPQSYLVVSHRTLVSRLQAHNLSCCFSRVLISRNLSSSRSCASRYSSSRSSNSSCSSSSWRHNRRNSRANSMQQLFHSSRRMCRRSSSNTSSNSGTNSSNSRSSSSNSSRHSSFPSQPTACCCATVSTCSAVPQNPHDR